MTTHISATAALTPRIARHHAMGFLRAAGIALLSGMAGGAMWGIGARAAMRVLALAAHHHPEFNWQSTLAIIAATAFAGAFTGLGYMLVQHLVPGGWFRKGIIFGALVLLIHGYLLYQSPPFKLELWRLGPDALPLTIALFAPLLLCYGNIVAILYDLLDRQLLRGHHNRIGTIAAIALLAVPLIYEIVIGVLIYLIATEQLTI